MVASPEPLLERKSVCLTLYYSVCQCILVCLALYTLHCAFLMCFHITVFLCRQRPGSVVISPTHAAKVYGNIKVSFECRFGKF